MRHDEIFERLDPPPGGLAALRSRMALGRRAALRQVTVGLAFAAAAVLLVVEARRGGAPDFMAAARRLADAPEIALGLAPAPRKAVAIEADDRATTALAEVPTGNPAVSFYWVSSTSWGE